MLLPCLRLPPLCSSSRLFFFLPPGFSRHLFRTVLHFARSHDVQDLEDDAAEADAAESHSHHHRHHRDFIIDQPIPKLVVNPDPLVSSLSLEKDEKIAQSVLDGTTPSYSLESNLSHCKRATTAIRREALQRMIGRNLQG